MTANRTAAQRIADLREEYKRDGEDVTHLSDAELLLQYLDLRERDLINTRDRYMALLTEQRKHSEQVRASVWRQARERVDRLAVAAVQRMTRSLTTILGAVEVLPDRVGPDRVALLKRIAADARHTLRLEGENPNRQQWRLDNNHDLVNNARSVLGVLGDRDGISADEVIRLVGEALKPNGNLQDLFAVADSGALKPHRLPQPPLFMGEYWIDLRDIYAYQPEGSRAHVKAYQIGDAWYLDLWAERGALLAFGVVPVEQVAAVADVLIARAEEWTRDRSTYPWQRFEQALADVRAADPAAA